MAVPVTPELVRNGLELVLQRRVKFDIDVSFNLARACWAKQLGGGDVNNYTAFSGISLATLAQFQLL